MQILYYTWGECMYQDVVESLSALGHTVITYDRKPENYDYDEIFDAELNAIYQKDGFDIIFSMNYMPIISRFCQDKGILYISWTQDSPLNTLYSLTVTNDCNRIFCFDQKQAEGLARLGAHVDYMPIATNARRIASMDLGTGYKYPVSFVGHLYDDGYNQLDKIENMPEELSGYIQGVIDSARLIYGYDLVSATFNQGRLNEMKQYAHIDLGPDYRDCASDMYLDFIRRKITIVERRDLLTKIGLLFPLSIGSYAKPEGINCDYLGYVDYNESLPHVFHDSKINLNFTLRSILSGIPPRVTDCLCAGGFMITNFQTELPFYYENHKDLVWFENEENLLDLIAFYLEHDTEREAIAANGMGIARNAFSYERLLPRLLDQAMK